MKGSKAPKQLRIQEPQPFSAVDVAGLEFARVERTGEDANSFAVVERTAWSGSWVDVSSMNDCVIPPFTLPSMQAPHTTCRGRQTLLESPRGVGGDGDGHDLDFRFVVSALAGGD